MRGRNGEAETFNTGLVFIDRVSREGDKSNRRLTQTTAGTPQFNSPHVSQKKRLVSPRLNTQLVPG
jgi:hypothetical protein